MNFLHEIINDDMTRYLNLNGNSGVVGYEIGSDSILIEFKGGARYLYNHIRPGRAHLDQMKDLALSGSGLNSYIGSNVKKNFYQKLN